MFGPRGHPQIGRAGGTNHETGPVGFSVLALAARCRPLQSFRDGAEDEYGRPEAWSRRVTDAFTRFDDADIRDLVAEFPLAWIVARDPSSDPAAASLLPLLGEYDETGRLVRLLGHLGRRNPLYAQLTERPAATILFNGPHGYVSPAQAGLRDWGPTWNYAQLTVAADVVFEPADTDDALAALVEAMEGPKENGAWSSAELGDRYAGMAGAIVAFRAHVTAIAGRFKLGQDERRPVFDAILRNHPDVALVRWMRRFDR